MNSESRSGRAAADGAAMMSSDEIAEWILREADLWVEVLESRLGFLREAQRGQVEASSEWSLLEALVSLAEQCVDCLAALIVCTRAKLGRPAWILARTVYLAYLQTMHILTDTRTDSSAAREYLNLGHEYRDYLAQVRRTAIVEAPPGTLAQLGVDEDGARAQAKKESAEATLIRKPTPTTAAGMAADVRSRTGGEYDQSALQYDHQFTLMSGAAHAFYHGKDVPRDDALRALVWALVTQVGPLCGAISNSSDVFYAHTKDFYESSKNRILAVLGLESVRLSAEAVPAEGTPEQHAEDAK
jgi:hypothetical protein